MENQNDIFSYSYIQQIFIEHCYMPGPVLLAGEISMSKTDKSPHSPRVYILMGRQLQTQDQVIHYTQGLRPTILLGTHKNVLILISFKSRKNVNILIMHPSWIIFFFITMQA